ncbi:glycerol-3-phosphate dehydrogenase/oxidase [Vagococcus hydrophili]|uniref:Alpha-glycerophosphate oxidase n=1 Tax=Vagococcus hydrophili TaxID=2714947 RepID=A0A6G8APT0_9ENTE|nr:glycerol-3-phosphate dehydrogenase/oxidase [Vagococcus hydrophili]QIL47088.1 glycerol-3-phosphate dehydrogenase/oxidase [Vagococcus hydrophili]
MLFSNRERIDHLEKMSQNELDVLVIGGGITGAGIILDGVGRGLNVGLVEMRDFSSGTSSRSTKLVHGGLRYLAQFDVKTVAEVGQERAVVYENAPHVTTPLKMVLPFYDKGTFGSFTTSIGLDIYDRLARVKKEERKFMLDKKESLKREPFLKEKGLKGTGVYVEYRTDDSRLTLETIKKANEMGGLIASYAKVVKLLYSNTTGNIIGVTVLDTINKKEYPIYAKRIINAAGPWVDSIREMDNSKKGKFLHLTKGVHVVVDNARFPITNSIYFDTPYGDGRMMFAIPREEKVYIGTTDTFYEKNPAEPEIKREDVTYIIEGVNQMFDIEPLKLEDVESAWAGVRPLIHEDGKDPSEISRRDEIFVSDRGLYSIAGGKLTGYRKMAEEIVDKVLKDMEKSYEAVYISCQTKNQVLSGGEVGGGQGFEEFVKDGIRIGTDNYNLTEKEASQLTHRYGSNVTSVYQYLMEDNQTSLDDMTYAMLRYGLEEEMVIHPIDFLLRRSSTMLFNIERCLNIKEEVINYMSRYFDWDEATLERIKEEVEVEINQHTVYSI